LKHRVKNNTPREASVFFFPAEQPDYLFLSVWRANLSAPGAVVALHYGWAAIRE
jgi:hypothetical protein